MSITANERKNADAHMGPGESFPVDVDGEHLKAAWDLAGHAANPEQVRRNILAFARKHNLLDHLPETAKDHMMKKSYSNTEAGDILQDMLDEWFGPEEVVKSVNPIEKSFKIVKAYESEAGLVVEGWVSTNDQDQQKDIIEPEAFLPSIDGYFANFAPISLNHNQLALPVGHLQRGALVRDGQIFHEALHPMDAAEFEHFPGSGSGFYARGVLTDTMASDAVRKGNVGGFSFIGNGRKYTRIPGGGRRFTEVNPLTETTVAAYPINTRASMIHVG